MHLAQRQEDLVLPHRLVQVVVVRAPRGGAPRTFLLRRPLRHGRELGEDAGGLVGGGCGLDELAVLSVSGGAGGGGGAKRSRRGAEREREGARGADRSREGREEARKA